MTDLELFARLIQCEAGGEGDNGMKAVASVVMNRVRTSVGEYGRYNTIPAVIYQDGQFNCVRTRLSGRTNLQNVYNMNPTNVHYEIAEWAMAGGRLANLWEALWFFNPYSSTCPNNFHRAWGIFKSALAITAFTIQRRRMPIPDGKTALAVRGIARRIPSRKDCRRKTF